MAKGPQSMLEDLADEAMSEMASNFFGARKDVEEMLERIHGLEGEVRHYGDRALRVGALLHALLPEGTASGFYVAMGVDPVPFMATMPAVQPQDMQAVSVPMGLTARSRYIKLVLATYDEYRHAVEQYLHGSYQEDRRYKGRKFLTPNLKLLKGLVATANERIATVNASPSQVLRMAHSMDVGEVERERMTGATLDGFDQALDRDLAYDKVDLAAMNLPELIDLPPLEDVRAPLSDYLKSLWGLHSEAIRSRIPL